MTAERDARILVVDDNVQNIALVQAQLERAGYAVIPALGGQAGIDAAIAQHPDLVLLDIMMPGIDGYEVCRLLRENESTRALPIVMLTSLQEREDRLKALEAGADDFLSKPVDRAELLARVRSSLRMKRTYDDLARTRNVTDRQADQLRTEKSRGDAILSSMSDGVLMTDSEGKITFVNSSVERMTGAMGDDLQGQTWHEALSVRTPTGQPIDPESCPVMEAIRSNLPVEERELAIWRPDGREVAISLAASPIQGPNSAPQGGVIVFRDVTSQREVQRMKEEFVSLVSHELRTPLAAIYGFAELLLERERLSDTARTYVETMYKEADRMTSLVNDFLDIERLASGRMSFHFRSLRVDEIIADAREDLASQLGRHAVVVDAPRDPMYIRADRDRVLQVLLNLLANAIKYSPEGGEIRIRADRAGQQVRISVIDQGLGLPAESISRLFERFYRVDSPGHRRVSGTGLGLTICKQIVEGMGGRIWAESPGPGLGSTFCFTLPSAGAPAIRSLDSALGSPGRILLAKDDPNLAAVILEQLGPLGYAVEAVSSAEEAISHVRADKPAAVVLDIDLAGQPDGWGVLASLREDPSTAEIPVVLISGGEHEPGLALSVDELLVKPIPSQRLLAAIRRLVVAPDLGPIVVADGDPISREMALEILSRAGFEVNAVADGEAALDMLRRGGASAVLLDPTMPKLDGFGVLDAIRADEELRDLPVLFLTPKDLDEDARARLRSRASDVLRRPNGPAINITAALLRAIRSRAVRRPPAAACAMPVRDARPLEVARS